jgi:hypothetical protein
MWKVKHPSREEWSLCWYSKGVSSGYHHLNTRIIVLGEE